MKKYIIEIQANCVYQQINTTQYQPMILHVASVFDVDSNVSPLSSF